MRLLGLFLLVLLCRFGTAQSDLNARFLIYPAGKITTLQLSTLKGENWAWSVEGGYNFARRKDFGVQDNEEGGGPGIGVGARKYVSPSKSGFYVEANCQLWFMQIDWEDFFICPPNVGCLPVAGTTSIIVVQPTISAGYELRSKSQKWAALLGIAFGREINIRTKGEEVGQGGISLLTFSIARRL